MKLPRTVPPPLQRPVFALAEVTPVLVCRGGGAWCSGEVEAWRWDRDGWSAFVRYTEVDSEEVGVEWVPECSVWCQDGTRASPPEAIVVWSQRVG